MATDAAEGDQLGESVSLSGSYALVGAAGVDKSAERSEEHTSELQSLVNLVCRLLLEKKK